MGINKGSALSIACLWSQWRLGIFSEAALAHELGWSPHTFLGPSLLKHLWLARKYKIPSSLSSSFLLLDKWFLTVMMTVYITKRIWPQIFLIMDFSIIKQHFINNFRASACDPIHFQDMQRPLGPLPYVFLICQH